MIEYDVHSWREHLFDIRGSMVREILYRVMASVLFAVLVVLCDRYVHPVGIADKGHTLISVALGLLLVFRTNAAYDRFWEGRKLWGAMVNESRNLARAASVHMRQDPALLSRLLRLTMAFPYATMCRLRDLSGLGPYDGLGADEVQQVHKGAAHLPLALAAAISATLDEGQRRGLYGPYVQVYLDQNVQLLIDYMGGCERIHRTPIPFAYVVHLRRALLLYCLSLPFILVDLFGWWTVLVTLIIAYVLFGIEEIGVEIADPFGMDDNDLPLLQICQTIEGNLRALLPREAGPVLS